MLQLMELNISTLSEQYFLPDILIAFTIRLRIFVEINIGSAKIRNNNFYPKAPSGKNQTLLY